MINHARTLLWNQSPSADAAYRANVRLQLQQDIIPGEYIDPTFRPSLLPPHLQAVQRLLFGTEFDLYRHNFRLAQLMGFLHCKKNSHDFLIALDPRLTYRPEDWQAELSWREDGLWFENGQLSDPPATVSFPQLRAGQYFASSDSGGPCFRVWVVIRLETTTAVLFSLFPRADLVDPAAYGSPEDWLAIPETPHEISLNTMDVPSSAALLVEVRRPVWDIAALARMVRELPGSVISPVVMSRSEQEPYRSFRKMWEDGELLTQFAGFLLAYIYRLEELRNGQEVVAASNSGGGG